MAFTRRAAAAAATALLAVGLTTLPGCNTIRGMGQDTQAGGRAVERTADETQEQIEERRRREQDQKQNPGAPPPSSVSAPSTAPPSSR